MRGKGSTIQLYTVRGHDRLQGGPVIHTMYLSTYSRAVAVIISGTI